MIDKSKGGNKIFRIRVINLYEADYNLLLNIFGQRKLPIELKTSTY